jgi:hypothetical protein
MGKEDRKRNPQETARFDSAPFVAQMKTPVEEPRPEGAGKPEVAGPIYSRVATLHDPLTTGLLAEVARRAETVELDEETIEAARQAELPRVAKVR